MLEIVKIILPIGIMILKLVDVVNFTMVDVEAMKIVLPQIQSVKNVVVIEMRHQHQNHKQELHHNLREPLRLLKEPLRLVKELLKLLLESRNLLLLIKRKRV